MFMLVKSLLHKSVTYVLNVGQEQKEELTPRIVRKMDGLSGAGSLQCTGMEMHLAKEKIGLRAEPVTVFTRNFAM